MDNYNPKPRLYNGIAKSMKHQLGALAFIGVILFLAFLPQSDFIGLVTVSPHTSIERGHTALIRLGYNPEDFKIKKIAVQKLIGIGQLGYINRYCTLGAIDNIREMGVPLSLYELEFQSKDNSVHVWIDPSDGRIFTTSEYEPGKSGSIDLTELPTPQEAVDIIKKSKNVIDSLRRIDSSIVDTDSIEADSSRVVPVKEEISAYKARTQEIEQKIALGRRAIILAGINIEEFEIIDLKMGNENYDYHLIWQSEPLCKGAQLRISQDIVGERVSNMQVSLALPEYWFLQRESSWNYFRWISIGLFIAFSLFIILRRFRKSIVNNGLWQEGYNQIILLIFIIELLAAANLFPTHVDLEQGAIRFVSRFLFFAVTAIISWRTLRSILPPIVNQRRDRLIYIRDGIIVGLLSAVSLMGIHNFLLWIGGKIGFTIGNTFLLGQRSISTIPSYSGLFPAMNTLQQLVELIITLLPIVMVLFGILLIRYKKQLYFKIMLFISIAIGTLVQGTSPLLFAILLAGNLVIGLFGYYLIVSYMKSNIVAYTTAIMTYVLITDGFHYIRGAISPYFQINALSLFFIALIPVFVLLHISFFTELKEKFDGPIE